MPPAAEGSVVSLTMNPFDRSGVILLSWFHLKLGIAYECLAFSWQSPSEPNAARSLAWLSLASRNS